MTLPKKDIEHIHNIFKSVPGITNGSIKNIFAQDAWEVIRKDNLAKVDAHKGTKEVFYNFFGMNNNWKTGRNILGMVMVHCPEYPTYFIPTYTQTSQTGNAGHIKKGEKIRGLLTGGLEGLAVGALVSGEKIKGREMVPYIVLGAALQLLSSMLFPWLGEVMGKQAYKKKVARGEIVPGMSFQKKFDRAVDLNEIQKPPPDNPLQANVAQKPPAFSGRTPYNNVYSSRLKI